MVRIDHSNYSTLRGSRDFTLPFLSKIAYNNDNLMATDSILQQKYLQYIQI